jgi:transcription elongation factor
VSLAIENDDAYITDRHQQQFKVKVETYPDFLIERSFEIIHATLKSRSLLVKGDQSAV